jgi:hypothetical protein
VKSTAAPDHTLYLAQGDGTEALYRLSAPRFGWAERRYERIDSDPDHAQALDLFAVWTTTSEHLELLAQ